MDLVKVDGFDLEAAQAGLALQTDTAEGVGDLALLIPDHAALGEDKWLFGGGLDGAADDLLGVAKAVDGGGVDPVDAEVDGVVDGGDGVVVVLRAPGESPVAAADGPRAEADASKPEIRCAKLIQIHRVFLILEFVSGAKAGRHRGRDSSLYYHLLNDTLPARCNPLSS